MREKKERKNFQMHFSESFYFSVNLRLVGEVTTFEQFMWGVLMWQNCFIPSTMQTYVAELFLVLFLDFEKDVKKFAYIT